MLDFKSDLNLVSVDPTHRVTVGLRKLWGDLIDQINTEFKLSIEPVDRCSTQATNPSEIIVLVSIYVPAMEHVFSEHFFWIAEI